MVLTRVTVAMMVMAGVVLGNSADYHKMQTLRAKLLEGYDRQTLPLTLQGPILVNMSSLAIRNLYMDEAKHQVHLHSWITFMWNDPRLAWAPEEYGNLDKLSLSPNDIWIPDLTVYNSGDAATTSLVMTASRVIAYPNGKVLQVPPVDILYNCVADMTYWPHDEHVCKVKIGSWVYDSYTIDWVLPNDLKPTLEVTKEPEGEMSTLQWEVADTSSITKHEKFYACCEEPYVHIEANLVLVRMAPAYTWLIKIPLVCFSLLTLVIFLLPPDAGEKTIFGSVCLLLHLIFLVFAHDAIRSAPTHTPLIVKLVVVQLVLVAVSVVVAAVVVRIARAPNTSSPPSSLVKLAHSFSSVLLLSSYANEASGQGEGGKTEEVELADRTSGKEDQRATGAQWMFVGAFLDRLALFLCLLVIIIVLSSFWKVI